MMTSPGARELGIQGLGWFVRRYVEPVSEVEPFYVTALRLQALRPRPPGTRSLMLWAGDLTMVELNVLNPAPGSDARRDEVSLVMRTARCGSALRHLQRSGAAPMSRDHGPTSAATFVDPFGRLIGVQAEGDDTGACGDGRAPGSAAKREAVVAAQVPGATSPTAEFLDVYGIDVAVVDPVATAAFYRDLLGLEPLGPFTPAGAQLSLGRRARLRLLAGGRRHSPPSDRDQVPDVWVLRVFDHAALMARLQSRGVPMITVRRFTGGIIAYAVDPEGHLFGFQQRTPDLLADGELERVEDALANRLWAEGA